MAVPALEDHCSASCFIASYSFCAESATDLGGHKREEDINGKEDINGTALALSRPS